jgi:hypothetical protein
MSIRMQGRVAGLIYLGVVLTGIFALAYAASELFVSNDPAATAATLQAKLGLLKASNFALIAMCAFFLALPFALARFLAPYGRNASRLMIIFVALSIPFSLLAISQHFQLASLAEAGALTADAVAARIAAYDRWMDVASIFWGLWLAPLGWLVLKSGAIPRILGVVLILGCVEYLAEYFGPMIAVGYKASIVRELLSWTSSVGEIGTCLWLLAMGARGPSEN